jgi:tagatose-6-phosphate ketose/aldose isomerase
LVELAEDSRKEHGLTDTPREICQQPETWLRTLAQLESERASLIPGSAGFSIPPDRRVAQVILAGAGSSDYIGRALAGVMQQGWGCAVRAVPSTELLTGLDEHILPGGETLLISFSRSGDSSEGVALLELAQQRYPERVRHLVITCNAEGAMARMPGVPAIVLDDAVNDRGLAMTSSFTNMVIAGQYLAHIERASACGARVRELAAMAERLMPEAANLAANMAKQRFQRVCFLGGGAMQAAAHESALKVLELNAGKIATLAESFLGLRHGPMSFLNRETLVCAYVAADEATQPYELDLLEEIRAKNLAGQVVAVAPCGSARLRSVAHHVLDLDAPPRFPDSLRPPLDVIVGQLLALFLSIENGIRPDAPSDGAISRVVSHVRIHTPAAVGCDGKGRHA